MLESVEEKSNSWKAHFFILRILATGTGHNHKLMASSGVNNTLLHFFPSKKHMYK